MNTHHTVTFRNTRILLLAASLLTSLSLAASPGDPLNLWSHALDLNEIIFSAPAIGPTGTVVFGTKNGDSVNPSGNVYGFNPDGTIKWKYPFLTSGPDWFEGSPAIAADGTVYIGCWDNFLYAIDNDSGNELWRFNATVASTNGGLPLDGAIVATPAIGRDGTLYIGSTNGLLFAIWPNGQVRWQYETDPNLLSSILGGAVLNNAGDTVYVGDEDGKLHALSAASGTVQWTFTVPAEHDLSFRLGERGINAAPAIDSKGNVIFTCANGYVYMLSSGGLLKSTYAASDSILSSAVIDADDRIYFSSRDTYFYCIGLDLEGILDVYWETAVGDVLYSSPAVDDLGNVIVAGYTGDTTNGAATSIYCFDASGQTQWQPIEIPTINDSSINIAPDGSIYLGGYDGNMYKFEGAAPLAMAGWPRKAASRRQTGLGADIYAIDLLDYFPDIKEDKQGLSLVPWFGLGWIEPAGLPDIEHIDHGKLYVAYSDSTGIIFWDHALENWFFAFRSLPNYLYDMQSGAWLYHVAGTSVERGRWFYDFSIQDWIKAP